MNLGKVLITGGEGFLAKYVEQCLLDEDILPYRLFHGSTRSALRPTDFLSLDSLLASGLSFTTIFHLASHVPYGRMDEANPLLVSSNITLTQTLVQAFSSAHFIYSSSVSVYGDPEGRLQLHSPFVNPNQYGLSKLAAETIIRNYANYSIIRFSSLIGPGMKASSFVPIVLMHAMKNKVVKLLGDGSRMQNYLDIRDAARLCLAAAKSKGNHLILGVANRSYSNREIAEHIAALTGAAIEYDGVDKSPSYIYDWVYPEALNYRPIFEIPATIHDMKSFIEEDKSL